MKFLLINFLILLSFMETGLENFYVILLLLLGSCWMGLSGIFKYDGIIRINKYGFIQFFIFINYIILISLITFIKIKAIPITVTNLFISYIALSIIALIGRDDFRLDEETISAIRTGMQFYFYAISFYIVLASIVFNEIGFYQGRIISPGNALFGAGEFSDSHSFSVQYTLICIANLFIAIKRNSSILMIVALFCFSLFCISLIGSRSGSVSYLIFTTFLFFKQLKIDHSLIIISSSIILFLGLVFFEFSLNTCPVTTEYECVNRSFSFDPNSDSDRLRNLLNGLAVFGESNTWLISSPEAFLNNKQFYDMFALNALLSIGFFGFLYICFVYLSRPFFRTEYVFPFLASLFLLSEFILLPRILILVTMWLLLSKFYYDNRAI